MDSKVISLDIETYGLAKRDWWDRPLPPQRIFNPRGSLVHDGVPLESLILSVAITLPTEDPRCLLIPRPDGEVPTISATSAGGNYTPVPSETAVSSRGWYGALLAALRPGSTMVFQMHQASHRRMLRAWLAHADTLLGMNLQFDLQYLRMLPDFRYVLSPKKQTIIDLSVVNFLHSELRPERSLKTLGPVLGTHVYPEHELKRDRAYPRPTAEMLRYNGADTHNTLLAIAHLARRIGADFPTADKLSPYSLSFYSDAIWSCVRMSEAGIPVSVRKVQQLEAILNRQEAAHDGRIRRTTDLQMSGKGSDGSKRRFMEHLCDVIDSSSSSSLSPTSLPSPGASGLPASTTDTPTPSRTSELPSTSTPFSRPGSVLTSIDTSPALSVRSHRLLGYTDKKHELQFSILNRNLLAGLLPPDHPLQVTLKDIAKVNEAQKVVGTYTYPLLRHNRKKPNKWEDRLTPWPPSSKSSLPPQSQPPGPLSIRSVSRQPTGTLGPGLQLTPKRLSQTTPAMHRSLRKCWLKSLVSNKKQLQQLWKRLSVLRQVSATSGPAPCCRPLEDHLSGRSSSDPAIALAIPNWLVVPTHPKDGLGDEGGTKQGRIIAKAAGRPQTWPPRLKACFQSRFGERGVLVQADLAQIEPRLAALLSGDESMIAVFQSGADFHGDTSVRLFGPDCKKSPHWKTGDMRTDPRQWGKTGGLLMLYRGGWTKLQTSVLNDAGVYLPDELCMSIVEALPAARPQLFAWQDRLISETHKRGYMVLPFTGQSRWYMGGTDYDVNEIVNTPIQTYAGDILLRIQAALERTLPDLNDPDPDILLCHNWYDALYFDCRDAKAAARCRQLILDAVRYVETHDLWALLQNYYGHQVPLVIDIKEL